MKCRNCGCTNDRACFYENEHGSVIVCEWVEQDLCSACAYWPPEKREQRDREFELIRAMSPGDEGEAA